jgi:hypothetical protein
MYIHFYICIYVCMYIYIYMYIFIYIHMLIYVNLCMFICVLREIADCADFMKIQDMYMHIRQYTHIDANPIDCLESP